MINKDVKIIICFGVLLTFLLSAVCLFFSPVCAVLLLLNGLLLTGVFVYFTLKRYKKINELNGYLSLVCAGEFDLDISDNTEGELSILKNNLFKVMTLMRSQNELLNKDKIYLADSLADISHQLKTPLTSMLVITDLLKIETEFDKRKEFVSIIEGQLDKMKWLITNMLKLSRLDADAVDFKREKVSIKEIMLESIKPFLVTLDVMDITLENEMEDIFINGDRNWSIEAFQNIIKNCIEHTGRNGRLAIKSESTNIYSSVFIRDNGCGIAKKDLPHIFERFYHGENSSSDSVGIGLALAKMIFEKENADILVNSEENVGTEFEIRFYKSII